MGNILKRSNVHMQYQAGILSCVLLSFAAIALVPQMGTKLQQDDTPPWSMSERIPGAERSLHSRQFLIADRNNTIHLFNSQLIANRVSIVYSKWTLRDGWTIPNDILASPTGDARIIGVKLDSDGLFHVAFFGGDDEAASIYYSFGPIEEADNANKWSKPVLVGEGAITPTAGVLEIVDQGILVIAYSGNMGSNGLYCVHSDDNGEKWSEPSVISYTGSSTLWPAAFDAEVDDSRYMHLVWSVNNVSGLGEEIQYSRYDLHSNEWTEPSTIAVADRYEADTPSIIKYQSDLVVIYHNGSPTTRWMRWSLDGGLSWDPPVRLFENIVGSNGPASLVQDSSGVLHILFGGRTTDFPATHGMWHSSWIEDTWSEPTAVISGPREVDIEPGGEGFDPSFARAVISQGNLLMVTWTQDPGIGTNGIWYSFRQLETPRLHVTPFSTSTPSPQATVTPSPTRTPGYAPTPVIETVQPLEHTSTSPRGTPQNTLIKAMIPAVFFVGVIMLIHLLRGKRST